MLPPNFRKKLDLSVFFSNGSNIRCFDKTEQLSIFQCFLVNNYRQLTVNELNWTNGQYKMQIQWTFVYFLSCYTSMNMLSRYSMWQWVVLPLRLLEITFSPRLNHFLHRLQLSFGRLDVAKHVITLKLVSPHQSYERNQQYDREYSYCYGYWIDNTETWVQTVTHWKEKAH